MIQLLPLISSPACCEPLEAKKDCCCISIRANRICQGYYCEDSKSLDILWWHDTCIGTAIRKWCFYDIPYISSIRFGHCIISKDLDSSNHKGKNTDGFDYDAREYNKVHVLDTSFYEDLKEQDRMP